MSMIKKSTQVTVPETRNNKSLCYFVSLTTQNRKCYFGKIQECDVVLNSVGKIVQECWYDLPLVYPLLQLDLFVIMPNHLHGLLTLSPLMALAWHQSFGSADSPSIETILCEFLSSTAHFIHEEVGLPAASVWRAEFETEEIVDTDHLEELRDFIIDNPNCWVDDPLNPDFHPV